jgi:DNA-binding transcriptional LysR family regulator
VELRQLQYFVTVAEELHFGQAAERLHIVQPAVSQQVRRLERELGIELFDRSPRHVRLTSAGERFLPAARSVLAAADRARAVAAELGSGRDRAFRLGTVSGLGERLDAVLDALSSDRSGARVELVSLPVRERLAAVRAGELDAAFVRGPADSPDGPRFLPLGDDPLMAAIPARHPLAGKDELDLADLAELPLMLTERRNHPALVDLVLGSCNRAGFLPVPGPTHGSLLETLSAIGAGPPMWTVVYAANARMLRVARVAFRPIREPGLALPFALAVPRREGALSEEIRAVLRACRMVNSDETCGDNES